MKIKTSIAILLLGIVFSACDKKITWDAKKIESKLVVEGLITNEFKQHKVKLSKTMNYDASSTEKVSGANITISDGSSTYTLNEIGNGMYQTDSIAGEIDKIYTLNIELKEEIEGTSFYEASSEMKGEFSIDTALCFVNDYPSEDEDASTELIFVIYGTEAETEDDYYMFNLKEIGSDETYDLNDNQFFGDYGENGMTDIALFFEIEDSIPVGSLLHLELQSISEDFRTYVQEVYMEIDRYDPFGMMGPAANPKGNISGGALGFFRASAVNRYAPIIVEPQLEDE